MAPKRSSTSSPGSASKKQRSTAYKGKAIQVPLLSDSDNTRSPTPPLPRVPRQVNPPAPKKVKPQHRLHSPPADFEVNTDVPLSWFKNYTKAGMWKDGYANRPICFCESVDLEFLDTVTLPCVNLLKNSTIWSILNPGTIAYPRLTRLFYVNLSVLREKGILTLKSQVKNKQITLTASSLALILGLPEDIDTQSHPTREACLTLAQKNFLVTPAPTAASSSKSKPKQTHNALNLEAKLIFTILARCVMPRKHSRELITDNLLEILYLVLTGYEIDVPNLILSFMVHVINTPFSAPLPYANLFPKIFEFFEIDTTGEEQLTHKGIIDEECWRRLGIDKNLAGEWFLKRPIQADKFSADQRIEHLEIELDALRMDLNAMRADIVDRQDDTHEKLMVVNEKLNQLLFLTALSHRATTSIMPLDEDCVDHIQEVCKNVVINCERKVLKRPILRPTHPEPTILTVEEYGLVKKYRDDERKKMMAQMKANHTVLNATNRWRQKVNDMFGKYKDPDNVFPRYGEWYEEVVVLSDSD